MSKTKTKTIKIVNYELKPELINNIIDVMEIKSNRVKTGYNFKKESKLDLILNRLDKIDYRLDNLESKIDTVIKLNNLRTQ